MARLGATWSLHMLQRGRPFFINLAPYFPGCASLSSSLCCPFWLFRWTLFPPRPRLFFFQVVDCPHLHPVVASRARCELVADRRRSPLSLSPAGDVAIAGSAQSARVRKTQRERDLFVLSALTRCFLVPPRCAPVDGQYCDVRPRPAALAIPRRPLSLASHHPLARRRTNHGGSPQRAP